MPRTRLVMSLVLAGAAAMAAAQAPQFVISTYAGGVPPPTPVAALNASIGLPQSVATDASGNVYFVSLNCVFKLDGSGTLTRIAVQRLDSLGTMHGFRPAMPVTTWAATKP